MPGRDRRLGDLAVAEQQHRRLARRRPKSASVSKRIRRRARLARGSPPRRRSGGSSTVTCMPAAIPCTARLGQLRRPAPRPARRAARGSAGACAAGGGRARRGRGSSANACWSIRAVPWSARRFSTRSGATQLGRHDEPAQPQRRRQRLAGRAGVDHVLRREALQRTDGGAVVAVLGVVVVLDRDRAGRRAARPAAPCAARATSTTPVGCWCAGVTTTASTPARASSSTRRPSPSTGTGTGSSPARRDDHVVLGVARVLERDPPRAALGEHPADQAEPLGVAAGDHHALRRRRRRRAPGRGSRRARRAAPATPRGIAVAEVGVGHRRERLAQRAQPGARAGRPRRRARSAGSRSGRAASPARPAPASARPRVAGGVTSRPRALAQASGSPRPRAARRRRRRPGARRRAGGRGRGSTAPARPARSWPDADRARSWSSIWAPSAPAAAALRPRDEHVSTGCTGLVFRRQSGSGIVHQSDPTIAAMTSATPLSGATRLFVTSIVARLPLADAQHRPAGPRRRADRLVRRRRPRRRAPTPSRTGVGGPLARPAGRPPRPDRRCCCAARGRLRRRCSAPIAAAAGRRPAGRAAGAGRGDRPGDAAGRRVPARRAAAVIDDRPPSARPTPSRPPRPS